MSQLFASARIADLILLVMALEGVVLFVYWRLTRRGVAPSEFMLNLLSGFCLALALRGALTGAWWGWTTTSLALAGLAHAIDLTIRWRRASA
jgi:hypothetical protein